jgi:phosphatidylserine decarboxylase
VPTSPEPIDIRRAAGWLPEQQDLEDWLAHLTERVDQGGAQPLHPVMRELEELIESDPVVRMYLNQMIAQEPPSRDYQTRPLRDVPHLLRLMNAVLTMAPEFGASAAMTPLGGILDWTMGTPAGLAAYRDRRLNGSLRRILDRWCEFLDSPESLYVLNDGPSGWRSEEAARAVGIDQFQHDPDEAHWGFRSWNDFFTRRFREGARPVAGPDDDRVIANVCESRPYGISVDVQLHDTFWIKSQPYSLHDMLGGDESAPEFVGGTVFQSYLSATNYHRWHSPVTGTVVRAFRVQGTYYSEADAEGADAADPQKSQSYLAHVATRAVIVIEADNPDIGLVTAVMVGMSDVSSCVLHPDLAPGHRLLKGDEIGHFQYGGSTYCLAFRPGVIAEFALEAIPQPHLAEPPLVLVRAKLATAHAR